MVQFGIRPGASSHPASGPAAERPYVRKREQPLSWQDLGSIGELISAIAVVVSLVYLAFQIRQNTSQINQNTKAAQATAFDSSITNAMVARQAIFENEDVARIFHQGSIDPKALSEEELLRYRLIIHNVLWSIWNVQSQAQVGGVSAETWQAQIAILRRLFSSEGARWFWVNYSEEFGLSFQQEVAMILSEQREEGEHTQRNIGKPAA